ncbi:unnamed protein product, partial [Polarella glacialis]
TASKALEPRASFDESTRAAFVAALARKHGTTPNDPSWEILRWYFPVNSYKTGAKVPQDIAVACQISIAGWSKKSLAEFWKLAKEDAFENHNGEPRFIKIHSTVHSEVKVLAVGGQRDNVQIWCSWIALEFQQRITASLQLSVQPEIFVWEMKRLCELNHPSFVTEQDNRRKRPRPGQQP